MTIEPIRRQLTVRSDPATAFRVFTEQTSSWWPLDAHSIAADEREGVTAEGVVIEPREGGRIYEEISDGSTGVWGVITEWAPPSRLRIAWKPNDRPAAQATDLLITFSPDPSGTLVTLVHGGWEVLGTDAPAARDAYSSGWPGTIARFAEAVDTAA